MLRKHLEIPRSKYLSKSEWYIYRLKYVSCEQRGRACVHGTKSEKAWPPHPIFSVLETKDENFQKIHRRKKLRSLLTTQERTAQRKTPNNLKAHRGGKSLPRALTFIPHFQLKNDADHLIAKISHWSQLPEYLPFKVRKLNSEFLSTPSLWVDLHPHQCKQVSN